jgi:hypothetical protein
MQSTDFPIAKDLRLVRIQGHVTVEFDPGGWRKSYVWPVTKEMGQALVMWLLNG